jgi:hypothetical protein
MPVKIINKKANTALLLHPLHHFNQLPVCKMVTEE